MKYKAQQFLKICAPFALMIVFWAIANRYSGVNPALLPTPLEVGTALKEFAISGSLFWDILWSLRRAALGLLCGGVLGLFLGTVTGRIKAFNWLFSPVFNGFRALPPVAIVPLVIVWAGLGESGKIFITSWAAFFPVWLNTHAGVSSVDKGIIWAARSLGAKGTRLLFGVTLPAALSQILVGFRLAISTTLICVIVAEMTGAYVGLGFRLQISYLVFRVDRMLACLVVLALIGIGADRLFNLITSWLFPWIKLRHELQ
jgi:ABC-type nitrate/sulfonate/bicarbonate transport system permease component